VPARGASDGSSSYSASLALAFLRFLQAGDRAATMDPEERISASVAHELLAAAISSTGNEALGLVLGRSLTQGDVGAADFVIGTAPTVRAAVTAAGRYFRLVNDAVVLRVEAEGDLVRLEWDRRIPMPRGAEDFLMAGVYTTQLRRMTGDAPELECRFSYAAPSDLREHHATFGDAALTFSAPRAAYVFRAARLDDPVPSADPRLHGVLVQHADALLAALPVVRTLTDRVQQRVREQLPHVRPTARGVAKLLQMSVRTLDRRLEQEGTTFGSVVEELRRRLALEHLARRELSLAEIAFLPGFAHTAAFHRAFRRWTDTTPLECRRSRRSGRPGPQRPDD